MNIKTSLKNISMISALCAGLLLAPASVYAERHHGHEKHHKSQSHKSHKKHISHDRSHKKHGYSKNKHHGHKHKGHNHRGHNGRYHSHGRYGHTHNHHRRINNIHYSYYPWVVDNHYWNNGSFTFGYQNDHFGFTYRD